MRIGQWAEQKGDAQATALRFLQAGATCSPNDPELAYQAGTVARKRASWDLAELWFRHSSTVGRRSHDWAAHGTAYLALGNSYYHQGRYALAKREHMKALRVSRRHGLRELQGRACHDLLVTAILTREPGAEAYAQRAYQAYGARHANLPALAHDVAYYWHTHGHFARALKVFRAVLPHFTVPERRLIVLGSIGREAGECGMKDVFLGAWAEVWQLAPTHEGASTLPPAMVQLAYGALRLGEDSLAESAIQHALTLARSRGESDVVAEAEEFVAARAAASTAVKPAPAAGQDAAESESFADDLVTSLEALAASR